MNIRKITSMTLLVSLVVLIINSVVLYVVPEGRVAHWADWRFWGLSKAEWSDQHLTVGVLFVLAGLLHIYYNWRAVKSYLKNRLKEMRVFTPSFNIGLVITVLVVAGTYFHIPPFSTIVEVGSYFKEAAADKYGEPPYGHAELSSLKKFTAKEGIDLDQALELLGKAGMSVEGADQSLLELAKANDISPQELYHVIKPDKTTSK